MSPLRLHPPPQTPPTNHRGKQLQERPSPQYKESVVTSSSRRWLLLLLQPPKPPDLCCFYDWLFEPNERLHAPQSEWSSCAHTHTHTQTQNLRVGGLLLNLLQIICMAAKHMRLKGLCKPVVGIFSPFHLLLNPPLLHHN